MAGYGNAEYIARAMALRPQIEEANPDVDLRNDPMAKALYGTKMVADLKYEVPTTEQDSELGQFKNPDPKPVDPKKLMSDSVAGGLIGGGASIVSQLGAQQQQREMAKIENEMIRRRNLQQTIQEGSLGMQNAFQQRLGNLSKAYFS